jgi:nucleoid-associated protein YgaU
MRNVNMEEWKLLIRRAAPSALVKNRVSDQIKLIDSSFSDLICDISAPPESATMTAGASMQGGQGQCRYTVRAGDTLSKISREFYSNPN